MLTSLTTPTNDHFGGRIKLPGQVQGFAGTTLGATLEPGEPAHDSALQSTVWYTWTATADNPITIMAGGRRPPGPITEMRAVLPDLVVAVYQGDELSSLSQMAIGIGSVSFQALRKTNYVIAVGSPPSQEQDFALTVTPVPLNDQFQKATLLPEAGLATVTTPVLLRSATREPSEPNHAGVASGHSLWWTWIPKRAGPYTWTSRGNLNPSLTSPTVVAAVYTGPDLEHLNVVASNAWGNLTFTAQANTRYYIALDLEDARVSLASAAGSSLLFSLTRQPDLLSPARLPNGSIEFVLAGSAGQVVALERSSDLQDWHLLRTMTLSSADYRFRETPGFSADQRFYRVLRLSSPY
jgi:hypothetical protein